MLLIFPMNITSVISISIHHATTWKRLTSIKVGFISMVDFLPFIIGNKKKNAFPEGFLSHPKCFRTTKNKQMFYYDIKVIRWTVEKRQPSRIILQEIVNVISSMVSDGEA